MVIKKSNRSKVKRSKLKRVKRTVKRSLKRRSLKKNKKIRNRAKTPKKSQLSKGQKIVKITQPISKTTYTPGTRVPDRIDKELKWGI